jgi:hypothetical protein
MTNPMSIATMSMLQVTVKGLTKEHKLPGISCTVKIGERGAFMREGNSPSGRVQLVVEQGVDIDGKLYPYRSTITFEDEKWGWAAEEDDPGHPGLRDSFVSGANLVINFPKVVVAVNWDGTPAINASGLLAGVTIDGELVVVETDPTREVPNGRGATIPRSNFKFTSSKGLVGAIKGQVK